MFISLSKTPTNFIYCLQEGSWQDIQPLRGSFKPSSAQKAEWHLSNLFNSAWAKQQILAAERATPPSKQPLWSQLQNLSADFISYTIFPRIFWEVADSHHLGFIFSTVFSLSSKRSFSWELRPHQSVPVPQSWYSHNNLPGCSSSCWPHSPSCIYKEFLFTSKQTV